MFRLCAGSSLVKSKREHSKEVGVSRLDSSSVCILLPLDDRHQRGVLNFTFRDSVKDFVNVAYWLPPKDLIIIGSKFSTGDVGRDIGQRMTYETLFDALASFYPSSRGETQS